MSTPDNPYRFTVKVRTIPNHKVWWVDLFDHAGDVFIGQLGDRTFSTMAEANRHADMILLALQGATREYP